MKKPPSKKELEEKLMEHQRIEKTREKFPLYKEKSSLLEKTCPPTPKFIQSDPKFDEREKKVPSIVTSRSTPNKSLSMKELHSGPKWRRPSSSSISPSSSPKLLPSPSPKLLPSPSPKLLPSPSPKLLPSPSPSPIASPFPSPKIQPRKSSFVYRAKSISLPITAKSLNEPPIQEDILKPKNTKIRQNSQISFSSPIHHVESEKEAMEHVSNSPFIAEEQYGPSSSASSTSSSSSMLSPNVSEEDTLGVFEDIGEEIERKVKLVIEEFLYAEDLNEAQLCLDEIAHSAASFPVALISVSPTMSPEEVGKSAMYSFFISTAISLGIEKREHDRDLVVRLLAGLVQHSVFTWRHLEKGLRQTLTSLADWEVDSPFAGRHVADMIAALILQGGSRWEDKNVMRCQLQLDRTLKGSKLSPKQFMEIIDQRTQQNWGKY